MSKKAKFGILIQFFASFSFFVVQIFIPQFAENLNASRFQIGIIATFFSLSLFISSWISGRIADKIGRRKVLLAGFAFSAFAFSLGYFAKTYPELFLLRMFAGFTAGIYPGALAAYVYESGGKMGKYTAFGALGMAFSQFISGVVVSVWDIPHLFLISGFTYVISFLAVIFGIRKERYEPIKVSLFPDEVVKRNKDIYIPLFLRHTGATGIWAYWVLYLGQIGASNYWKGMLNVFNFGTQFLVMFFVIDKISGKKSVGFGLLLSAVSFFYYASCKSYLWVIPGMILTGIAWSFLYAGSLKEVTERNRERATASGLVQSSISLGNILGPLVASIVVSLTKDYRVTMYFAASVTLVAYLYYLFARKGITGLANND